MNTLVHAPAQLPFAPRPISTELLSSWLLRVAGANLISLQELLDGLESQYGRVLTNIPIDYGIPEPAVMALSQFCQTTPRAIRAMDLLHRVPEDLSLAMLLRFRSGGVWYPRYRSHRLGYAFCPACLADQKVIHVPWEWSLACVSCCKVHQRPLLQGCPACREDDPLTFTAQGSSLSSVCHSCSGNLGDGSKDATADIRGKNEILAVDNAYRAALAGVAPALLPKTTPRAFRLFIEEMLQFLTRSLNHDSGDRTGSASLSRQEVLAIIAALVSNAAPDPHQPVRHQRGATGVRMWATVLSVIPRYEGAMIERSSIRWPIAIRRRFLSGLRHRTRKLWPYTPYRAATNSFKPVNRVELAAVFGLPDRTEPDLGCVS